MRGSMQFVLVVGMIAAIGGCGGPLDPLPQDGDPGFVGKADGKEHRPICLHEDTDEEGWYWGDTGKLIENETCSAMSAPTCCQIGSLSESWCSDGKRITWAHCHRAMGIALRGESCGGHGGHVCQDSHAALWCARPEGATLKTSGTCRDMGGCIKDEECTHPDNLWVRIQCPGRDTCRMETCVRECRDPEEGTWSWTTVRLRNVESQHKYEDGEERTWVVRKQRAASIQLHFPVIELEEDFDYLHVSTDRDRSGGTWYTGTHEDVWTDEFEGDTLYVTLVPDTSINAWGFQADRVSYYEQLEAGSCNRDVDCPGGQSCDPATCTDPFVPCYGTCVQ